MVANTEVVCKKPYVLESLRLKQWFLRSYIITDHLGFPYRLCNVLDVDLICLTCLSQIVAKIVLEEVGKKS